VKEKYKEKPRKRESTKKDKGKIIFDDPKADDSRHACY